jgi:hypothetical protein
LMCSSGFAASVAASTTEVASSSSSTLRPRVAALLVARSSYDLSPLGPVPAVFPEVACSDIQRHRRCAPRELHLSLRVSAFRPTARPHPL